MTRKQFEREFRTWQNRLGLDAWHVEINWDEPARKDCDATTWRSDDYDRAVIKLDVEWPSWDDDFTRRIIVHELLHLLTRDVDEVFDSLETQLQRDLYTATQNRYKHEIEGLVDRLSYRLVEIAA